jgi:hypothetical protein
MARDPRYFPLSMASLRALGAWAADCAERALPVLAARLGSDPRPRAAIDGIRIFANGGKRTAELRTLALAAFSVARETGDPAVAAAARAAGLAASSAYTHPLADVQQTKHILGPAAYAALALELSMGRDHAIGDREAAWAVEHVPSDVRGILLQMPTREPGRSRLEEILYRLDAAIRSRL